MLPQFEAETADQVWRQAAAALLTGGEYITQRGRNGDTRELLHCTLHVRDPRQRWALSRQPSMNPAFAIAEVVWILCGRNDSGFLNFWNPVLPKFAGEGAFYHGAYGHRLSANFGIDQVERAYRALAADQDSRQVVLQIWDPNKDLPDGDGKPQSKDIPCNIVSLLKVRNGKLDWLQLMRSNDLYRGAPHNFIQFTSLQEVMAGWLGVELGSYIHVADSLHLYERDLAEMSITSEMPALDNEDRLGCPWPIFIPIIRAMERALDELRSEELKPNQFTGLVADQDLPEGWRNLLRIVAADAARRRGWMQEMEWAASTCSNRVLNTAWTQWLSRTLRASHVRGI
ncbi:MAG: thymidylate synthase [Solirubrobacterales bacterium]